MRMLLSVDCFFLTSEGVGDERLLTTRCRRVSIHEQLVQQELHDALRVHMAPKNGPGDAWLVVQKYHNGTDGDEAAPDGNAKLTCNSPKIGSKHTVREPCVTHTPCTLRAGARYVITLSYIELTIHNTTLHYTSTPTITLTFTSTSTLTLKMEPSTVPSATSTGSG